ncbi:MAG: hypothetical protein R2726_20845 [Acidimicrobiales bacterium]
MIRFIRTAHAKPEYAIDALFFAVEVAEYLNDTYPDNPVEVFTQRFGPHSRLVWSIDFEDLAAFETYQAKLNQDGTYWEVMGKTAEWFTADGHDQVLAPIELPNVD